MATVHDQATLLYSDCPEIVVAPNGDRWDVFDGFGGPRVDTVDAAVLTYLDDNFDSPVRLVDGSLWEA